MMNRRYFLKLSCLILFFILSSDNALAHRVTVFAWVEGDTVLGEGKFSGGKKAQNSEIIVWDLNRKILLRTRTDKKGEFSFPIPEKTAMRIELIAGMGHKAEWTIPFKDLDDTATIKSAQDAGTPAPPPAGNTHPEQAAHPPASIDPVQLEAIVEKAVTKALNKKITPLTRMVAELDQKGPTINEILGGIGYIFGLMGVAMYFSSRKKNKKTSND